MSNYINVEGLCTEIIEVMKNNFTGTPEERFNKTKKLLVDDFINIIEDNRKSEIVVFLKRF